MVPSVDTISQDTAICGSFYFPLYELAKGIGLARKAAEAGNQIFITGAIIRGVQYGTVVSVDSENQINDYKSSFDVYPNLFNSETILKFSLENPSDVIIILYDILGNEVGTILKSYMERGIHEERFSPSELNSNNLTSGIYLITIYTNKQLITKKVILLK